VNSENNTSSGRACFSEQLKLLFQPILQMRQEDCRVLVVNMAWTIDTSSSSEEDVHNVISRQANKQASR